MAKNGSYSDVQLRVFEVNKLLSSKYKRTKLELSPIHASGEVIVSDYKSQQLYSGPYNLANTFLIGLKLGLTIE